jgi:hypothetical protein
LDGFWPIRAGFPTCAHVSTETVSKTTRERASKICYRKQDLCAPDRHQN